MIEQQTGLVKGVSTLDVGLGNKDAKSVDGVREKVGGQIVEPDDKEAAVTQAEHCIRMVVLKEADEVEEPNG